MDDTRDGRTRRDIGRGLGASAGLAGLGGSRMMLAYMGLADTLSAAVVQAQAYPGGYGRDPQLRSPPRRVWPSRLDATDRSLLARLADVVLPLVEGGPAPSAIGVADFLDEWLSGPYPQNETDRTLIAPLLQALAAAASMTAEATQRFQSGDPAMRRFAALTVGGFVATREGQAALGFIGDQAQSAFQGPPDDVVALIEARAAAL